MSDDNIKQYLADSELLLNAVGEGVYGFDRQGHAVFINPAAEQMTGWSAQELLGKSIHEYHHHSHADGSCYPAHECKIYGTVQDGISRKVSGEVFWRKDGSSFPVEYTTTPVYKNNQLIGAVAVFRDVSEQHAADLALRQALSEVKKLTQQLQTENTYLINELQQQWSGKGLVGTSVQFEQMLMQLELVAKTQSTVLILGENGTGKELVARNIHRLSSRANSPLIKVNCAAFTDNLLESELFGHERGAFTGAVEARKGRFEIADNGTIFLDEIGELSLGAQSKLLQVLQEQEFERVGGNKTIKVDIRVIAATNRDLAKMVDEGTFRMDLFYRLNVFPINLPPLRDRIEDLEPLCQVIISKLNAKLGKKITAISNKSLRLLKQYHWPGNIRELQNILEHEAILATSDILTVQHNFLEHSGVKGARKYQANMSLAEAEKHHITATLDAHQWLIGGDKGAAKALGVPESTLRSRMKKLDIVRPQ
ncbi:sigma-54-dependent Fis family transcriptional regulator [Psychrobium sp. 1_MG-2023]|uniref:sigma-54 interaction domain-containing protein n=1 Tax=Psychrobium sp. 1_MG-2023 TaxID=3062624 RepID=UPI000C32C0C0|nr:sigma 54-interacting transcriptional regulator [Psychrobium sp. 1_MG-2023]MDP2560485.1 sigma 54-interacting transcriptional regulator [Psychrobium sp. 1_MG-2023]PKF57856.1 Fis family transcriptional regulator [Alteromonadales bacterium alter-6D02]